MKVYCLKCRQATKHTVVTQLMDKMGVRLDRFVDADEPLEEI